MELQKGTMILVGYGQDDQNIILGVGKLKKNIDEQELKDAYKLGLDEWSDPDVMEISDLGEHLIAAMNQFIDFKPWIYIHECGLRMEE